MYYHLEEATIINIYAASIKYYQQENNYRGAWLELNSQYAVDDIWKVEINIKYNWLHTSFFWGRNNVTLEKFIAQHWNAYASIQKFAEHVAFQLPNKHKWVTYILHAILCKYSLLLLSMALMRNDAEDNGKMNDF